MTYMNQNELVIDITHAFIAQAAPEELPLFPGLSQIYRENPENITRPESGKDQMLGFGWVEVAPVVTPFVMMIVTEVLTYGSKKVVDSAVDAFLTRCWNAFRRLFRIPPRPKDVPEFTPEQLAQVREMIIKRARDVPQPVLSEEQAQLLADVVVKNLTTAQLSAQLDRQKL